MCFYEFKTTKKVPAYCENYFERELKVLITRYFTPSELNDGEDPSKLCEQH